MVSLISKEKENGLLFRISNYRKEFKNWPEVVVRTRLNMFPFEVMSNNGYQERIENWGDLVRFKLRTRYEATFDNDHINFKFRGKTLSLNWENGKNGDLSATFINEDYRKLDVAGRDVLDIGANIGDTSIYFSLMGSKRVIALEPFFRTFKLAAENIRLNQMENIELLNAGLSDHDGSIILDPEINGDIRSKLTETETGVPTEIFRLETLMDRFGLIEPVIKMDCEGCEYKALLSTPNDTLSRVRQILVEYHSGFKNIETKLKSSGFEVFHTRNPSQGLLLGNNENFI